MLTVYAASTVFMLVTSYPVKYSLEYVLVSEKKHSTFFFR